MRNRSWPAVSCQERWVRKIKQNLSFSTHPDAKLDLLAVDLEFVHLYCPIQHARSIPKDIWTRWGLQYTYSKVHADCRSRLVLWEPLLVAEAEQETALADAGVADEEELDVDGRGVLFGLCFGFRVGHLVRVFREPLLHEIYVVVRISRKGGDCGQGARRQVSCASRTHGRSGRCMHACGRTPTSRLADMAIAVALARVVPPSTTTTTIRSVEETLQTLHLERGQYLFASSISSGVGDRLKIP